MTDLIRLQGLRLMGTHGALPEEQGRAQPFEVDVDMSVDLSASGRTDALADTVHYGDVSAAIAKVVTGE
ncbi:MAG: dihydroneopterin aldolase, partial [Acidimicrobiales bacterium]|nr:dihydroneopterin aldolase [Acidimicrobiales bacterium]